MAYKILEIFWESVELSKENYLSSHEDLCEKRLIETHSRALKIGTPYNRTNLLFLNAGKLCLHKSKLP